MALFQTILELVFEASANRTLATTHNTLFTGESFRSLCQFSTFFTGGRDSRTLLCASLLVFSLKLGVLNCANIPILQLSSCLVKLHNLRESASQTRFGLVWLPTSTSCK